MYIKASLETNIHISFGIRKTEIEWVCYNKRRNFQSTLLLSEL